MTFLGQLAERRSLEWRRGIIRRSSARLAAAAGAVRAVDGGTEHCARRSGRPLIVQQEELAHKHLTDQQRLRANEFERALAAQLDRVRVNPRDPAVAVVATLVDGR